MHLLFEEDGGFKTGTILADHDASLQVETASGKRSKVKSTHVLLRFAAPAPGGLLEAAAQQAAEMDPEFLWECAGDGEFSFLDFAHEYYGHPASALEAAGVLVALHTAPVHFHRKGKGRYRKAPVDILQAALAGLEKKRQQALAIERMAEALSSGSLPDELRPLTRELLYKPDRNRLETKAFETACTATGESAAALLMRVGALRSAYDYHLGRFLFETFPKGTDFPPIDLPDAPAELPLADVTAFSIDDAATTEIDDAFSLRRHPDGRYEVGIHIAAPGLGFTPDSPIDAIARQRLSTVYMPGRKLTMLPDALVDRFTLAAGRTCPAVSLYLSVSPDHEITSHRSVAERVPVAANLRHHDLEPVFNEDTLAAGLGDFPFAAELQCLWTLAKACEVRRGKPSARQGLHDFSFELDGDLDAADADADACRIRITPRKRGSPLDLLVAELMIVANSTWGAHLAEHGAPGLYRAQSAGRVRMTTQPAPHDGLGVAQYAWCTSPLRRYADLVNQWQLLACLQDRPPPFPQKSEALFAILRDFDLAYTGYADFQRQMERYWCLRWLLQEGYQTLTGVTTRREAMVRIEGLPLVLRVPSVPALAAGVRVALRFSGADLLALNADTRFVDVLGEAGEMNDEDDEDNEELPAPPADANAPVPGAAVA